jgi:hypothetical protein
MTIVARFYEDGKGVAGHGVTADGSTAAIVWTRQVTVNTMNIDLAMNKVRLILDLILVAGRTEGISGGRSACLLGVDLVTVNTGYANVTVLAQLPFGQRAGVAAPTHLGGGGNQHAFLGMLGAVGTMTGFTGYSGQYKLSGRSIISRRMTGKTFAGPFYLLQKYLENWIK